MNPALQEVGENVATFGGASACAECAASFGLDPALAGGLAVLLATAIRLAVDYGPKVKAAVAARRKRAAR